jgi:peptide deformylase
MKSIVDKAEDFAKIARLFPEMKYAGDPILREITSPVTIEEGKLLGKRLGEILIKYRKAAGYGRGFAAPQIGENKAVFVTLVNDEIEYFINPKILSKSTETNFYKELCLSSGIMAADVERAESLEMEWTDKNGINQRKNVDGFLARLYQHEEAHLRGLINLDEAAPGGIEIALFDPLKEQLRTVR